MLDKRKRAKGLRVVAGLVVIAVLAILLTLTVLAADRGVWNDWNGTPYNYVIGYVYSGTRGNINTRELFVETGRLRWRSG